MRKENKEELSYLLISRILMNSSNIEEENITNMSVTLIINLNVRLNTFVQIETTFFTF